MAKGGRRAPAWCFGGAHPSAQPSGEEEGGGALSFVEQQHAAAIAQLQPEKPYLFIPNSASAFSQVRKAVPRRQLARSPGAPWARTTVHGWVRAHGNQSLERGESPATSLSLKGPCNHQGRSSISRWQTVTRDRCKDSWVPWHNLERCKLLLEAKHRMFQ